MFLKKKIIDWNHTPFSSYAPDVHATIGYTIKRLESYEAMFRRIKNVYRDKLTVVKDSIRFFEDESGARIRTAVIARGAQSDNVDGSPISTTVERGRAEIMSGGISGQVHSGIRRDWTRSGGDGYLSS